MQMKKLIFNSDDFGYSEATNLGIKKGYESGVITSTCLMPTGNAFEHAVYEVLPQIKEIGLGIHLDLIECKSLTNQPLLTNQNGYFNNGFLSLLLKSNDKTFLNQVEIELRTQIEKVLNVSEVDHINSHIHFHSIPHIFEIVSRLADEYKITNIRTQFEMLYFAKGVNKHFTAAYFTNIIKNIILNSFSLFNKQIVKKYSLNTNDFLIGVLYTGMMNENAVISGLNALKSDDIAAEILIHPDFYEDEILDTKRYEQYLLTQSDTIIDSIKKQGWQLINYKNID